MKSVRHLTPRDQRRVPWKNGRGTTLELALWPPGATFEGGGFDWRISKAALEEPGPFSAFPGFDRILVVIRGEALVLTHGDAAPRVRVRRLEPYRFPGGWPTGCELPAGPAADLNVLARQGGPSAEVQVLRLGPRRAREVVGPGHAFLHLLAGACTARLSNEEEPFELAAEESLWAQDLAREEELDVVGHGDDALALLVRIGPR